jgi:hypothetical protein
MELFMKRCTITMLLLAAFFTTSGCRQQPSDIAAIRAGILQHLTAVGTLNISAIQMDIRSVSINGNQAHAEVEFRPKTGAESGAGMQVAYDMEKRDGSWVVLKTQAVGGVIQHPDPNQNPHQNQSVHSGSLPNFSDVLNPSAAPAQDALPPGHPPVASQRPNSQPAPLDTTSAKKPR